MVNDRLVCFDEVFEMAMNCSLNVTLPPNFIKSPPKNPTVTPPGAEDEDGHGRSRHQEDVAEEMLLRFLVENRALLAGDVDRDGCHENGDGANEVVAAIGESAEHPPIALYRDEASAIAHGQHMWPSAYTVIDLHGEDSPCGNRN